MKFCPSCDARYEDAAKFCQHDGTLLRSVDETDDQDPYVGQVLLGQFEIKEVIGEGGMGRVYRGHQHGFDRPVAIKILHTDLTTNQEMVKRFNREAKIISRLDHPSIIHVYLFGELPDGNLYLAMEYVDGAGLTSLINEGPVPVAQTIHIGRQILSALTEAHRKGVVHRDLKPDNIMLVKRPDDPDTVKVLDFGIAKFLGSRTMLTQQGLVFGSARYISPEAAAGETVDERADLYAVGVILYQMLAGRPPFDDSSAVSLLMRHVNDAPPMLRDQPGAKHVPEPIAQVVMQSLEKDPSHRFDGAAAMRTALTEAALSSGVELPNIEAGVAASWAAPPLSNGAAPEPRGEEFRTDPMFGGTVKNAPPTLIQEGSGAFRPSDGIPTLDDRPSNKSPSKETPSKSPTKPERAVPSAPAMSAPSKPSAPPTMIEERPSDPYSPYGDPNDDEIELPRSRAWLVLLFIAVLALAGGALGALLAFETSEESPPLVDAGAPSPDSVSAGLTGSGAGEPPVVPAQPDAGVTAPDAAPSQPVVTPRGPTKRPQPVKTGDPVASQGGQPATADAGPRPVKAQPVVQSGGSDDQGMPPAASLSLEPRRPRVEQSVKLIAKITPPSKLESPRFVISSRSGETAWRDAKAASGGTYTVTYSFEKVGSYQITFVAKSAHGEVRAFTDAVVSARRERSTSRPQKTPTPEPQADPPLRPLPALDPSDNKPPGHEDGPPSLIEPWSAPSPW